MQRNHHKGLKAVVVHQACNRTTYLVSHTESYWLSQCLWQATGQALLACLACPTWGHSTLSASGCCCPWGAVTASIDENRGERSFGKCMSKFQPNVLEVVNELIVCWDAIVSMNSVRNAGVINLFKKFYTFGLWKFPVKNHGSGEPPDLQVTELQSVNTLFLPPGQNRAVCYGRFLLVDRDEWLKSVLNIQSYKKK